MPTTINPDNPNVFVCREGHVSKEANGIDYFTCKKIIREDDGGKEHPCRLKAIILDKEFAHALHRRGWEKRTESVLVALTRVNDELVWNASEA